MDEVDTAQARHHARVDTLMKADKRTLAEMYAHLEKNLLTPPEPWYTFGSHVGRNSEESLTFWGQGSDGMPLWERRASFADIFQTHGVN